MSMTECNVRLHRHSLEAFHATTSRRANLENKILGLMADGKARTDRQIANELNHFEPLRPRVTELIEQGRLHEVGSTTCETTGKKCRLTKRFL